MADEIHTPASVAPTVEVNTSVIKGMPCLNFLALKTSSVKIFSQSSCHRFAFA